MTNTYDSILYERFGKRLFDVIISLLLLVLLLPFYPFIVILLLLFSGTPLLFKQTRTGHLNQPFQIIKFRTMKITDKKMFEIHTWTDGVPDNFIFKSPQNTEVTKIGAFLRKTSIDELPQIINVLRGEMSLIGPRPEIPEITNCYSELQKKRLMMKPGMTGWAQVNGRADISHGNKIEFDLYYIKNVSFFMDLKILLRTILIILKCKGAY
ncbi:MAG: sugar transferase [Planococcaceae bacterium]|nr:sugar transferase [Planococcaceae bacterium]